jgi:hypothetical protein
MEVCNHFSMISSDPDDKQRKELDDFDSVGDIDISPDLLDANRYSQPDKEAASKAHETPNAKLTSAKHRLEIDLVDSPAPEVKIPRRASPVKRKEKIEYTAEAKKPKASSPKKEAAVAKKTSESHTKGSEPEQAPVEKKPGGFRAFMNRGGPIAPGSKSLPVGKDSCLVVRF